LLKNQAGILLIGDYTSLEWLNGAVHDINTRSPSVANSAQRQRRHDTFADRSGP
jgi:hypothetical protein